MALSDPSGYTMHMYATSPCCDGETVEVAQEFLP